MTKILGTFGERMLTRLVPRATAAADGCYGYGECGDDSCHVHRTCYICGTFSYCTAWQYN